MTVGVTVTFTVRVVFPMIWRDVVTKGVADVTLALPVVAIGHKEEQSRKSLSVWGA